MRLIDAEKFKKRFCKEICKCEICNENAFLVTL